MFRQAHNGPGTMHSTVTTLPTREVRLTVSVLLGVVHAGVLLLVATRLGYPVGPSDYSLVGIGWRYGGLVVVAAVPVWLALRYTLVTPVCACGTHWSRRCVRWS